MSIEERILNDSSCSAYIDKGRKYVEIAFRDGAEWGYEQGRKDALKLIVEMRKARNKYSALSREFCSKGMKPRQSAEWQEARKLTKKLETEIDVLLKELEE